MQNIHIEYINVYLIPILMCSFFNDVIISSFEEKRKLEISRMKLVGNTNELRAFVYLCECCTRLSQWCFTFKNNKSHVKHLFLLAGQTMYK